MKISAQGIELIKEFEGCRLAAYKCPAGLWTIGYGHTRSVKRGMIITATQAEQYLRIDLQPAETVLNCKLKSLTQQQFDALCSFIYNVGVGTFLSSTLFRKIQVNSNDSTIADELMRYKYAGGKIINGLIRRRRAEVELYFR